MRDRAHAEVYHCGTSRLSDPSAALSEALDTVNLEAMAFVLIYVPHDMALDALEQAIAVQLRGVTAFGCTTAGTITDRGYEDGALMVLGFPKHHFRCASILMAPLDSLSISEAAEQISAVSDRFASTGGWNRFALIMADGLSLREDLFVSAVGVGLKDVPVFGGSAGDGLEFSQTFVLQRGQFHTDAGLVILVETDIGFVGLGFDHFLPTDTQVVVTAGHPEHRHVCELNGSPAAAEYARLVGCTVEDLSPEVFAENPLLVRNGDSYHVRAVQKVEGTSCLSFLSAIDDGLILRIGQGSGYLDVLSDELSVKDPAGRDPCLILGFECILRRLEFAQKGLSDQVSQVLHDANVLGFCTYGEQHRGVHVNQTFVGVAFYPPDEPLRHD